MNKPKVLPREVINAERFSDMDQLNLEQIESYAEEKEDQWHSAATLQIKSLQKALASKNELFAELKSNFVQLKTDFKYNLKLLQDRDAELQSMDEIQQTLKVNESKFLSELSDLRIKTDNLKTKLLQEQTAKKEMEMHFKQRLIDQQTQYEILRTSKTKEMEELIDDFQKTKLLLEQENSQLKFQVEAQKLDLVSEMELLLKTKEKEQQKIEEDNHNQLVFFEMKNKLLTKEIEVCRSKEEEQQTVLQTTKKKADELSKELQKSRWDLTDLSSMKNSRILELEAKVKQLEATAKKLEQEFSERRVQLDKEIRRRETNLLASKQTLIDRERRFQEEIRSLETKVEMSKAEVNRALWDKNNVKAELEDKMAEYKSELVELREKVENEEIERSRSIVARDTEIALLKKREEILKTENNKLKDDVGKYKNDLVKSAKREEALERHIQQVKLNYGRKYDDAQSAAYVKAEDFASNLLKSRDVAVAERDRIRLEFDKFKEIQTRQDQCFKAALSTLEEHDLLLAYETNLSNVRDFSTVSTISLQTDVLEQNQQLKLVIKQMTAEMEELKTSNRNSKESSDNKYVESIENELIELKKEKRRMVDQICSLQSSAGPGVKLSDQSVHSIEMSENHPKIQRHINTLNGKIGSLEAEKVDMRAQLQKLQAKFDHQLIVGQQHEQESNSLSSKLQQIELEATTNKHRSEQEIKRLKNEISNLSLQLSESRREADEYYRGGIQNNLRAMELSDKVSQLTVGMAADSPWISNHTQAKMMQDLQDKISILQKQLAHEKQNQTLGSTSSPVNSNLLKALNLKLKAARDQIRALTQEKSMLLESSNKMRAELISLKQKHEPESGNAVSSFSDNSPAKEGKLEKMEKLQYDLTKKQLAFAQRRVQSSVDSLKSSESSDKEPSEMPTHDDVPQRCSTSSRIPMTNQLMMSSLEDASITDVWKVLEQEMSSPSIAGDQGGPKQVFSKKVKTSAILTKKKKKPKIRNYNVKDDSL